LADHPQAPHFFALYHIPQAANPILQYRIDFATAGWVASMIEARFARC